MKNATAKIFTEMSNQLEDMETKINRQIGKFEDAEEDAQEDQDVLDDLVFFRDALVKAREDMEHRIADAEEVLS